MAVAYNHTNENLTAIVAGLDLSLEDTVIAVGGSGDQAFAMLEFAGKIKVYDTIPEQLNYIKERAEALREENYDGFLKGEPLRDSYFLEDKNRLARIRERLLNLTIAKPGNIAELALVEEEYSRAYLSNAIGYLDRANFYELGAGYIQRYLRTVVQKLTSGGLIYVSDHEKIALNSEKQPIPEDEDLFIYSFLPPELELNSFLSMKAREYELYWHPAVYQKI